MIEPIGPDLSDRGEGGKCTENGGARAAVIMTVGGSAPDQQLKSGSITVRVVSEERHERCDAT